MSMKKNVLLIFAVLFVWAQTAVVAHVYGAKHLYYNAHVSCSECVLLSQCAGADVPAAVVLPLCDKQLDFVKIEPLSGVLVSRIYSYFSQAPPSKKLI